MTRDLRRNKSLSLSLSLYMEKPMFTGDLPVHKRLSRFAVHEVGTDLSHLSPNERKAIPLLIKVGKLLDALYIRQMWSGNEKLLERLKDHNDKQLLTLFDMYKGPWAREDSSTPFIADVPPRPEGANFYPEDMTKDEFEAWVTGLNEHDQKHAKGFYSVIRRNNKGELYHVPYSNEYGDILLQVANLFKHASRLVEDPSLSHFLYMRALAFENNKYLDSEVAWLKISKESKFEITAGPYEVYTDRLHGYKSAFEFYLHMRDFPSSKLLEKFSSSLQYVEDHLPIPDEYKNRKLVAPPIVVVNQLFSSGDVAVPMTAGCHQDRWLQARPHQEYTGGQVCACAHPDRPANDRREPAKIRHVGVGGPFVLLAIVNVMVTSVDAHKIHLCSSRSDAFTTHILLHEVTHSNGPHHIVNCPEDTVRSRLQEFHSQIEEAKADIAGLFAAALLIKSGVIENVKPEELWVTFLASAFRTLRFGITGAHGAGQAAQVNYLLDAGGFVHDASTGRYSVDFTRIEQAVSDLTRDIMILQGDGDKELVRAFVTRYANNRPETCQTLERIEGAGVPVDIRPIYTVEKLFPHEPEVEATEGGQ
ncbi:hypothetical protein BC936DRAFT_145833 [Jimgerdemannia flammicorona]|uniref:Peptidase family M49-domain-containing protein n=1 Tax=Jimgerdemannia flammicorona TaxID=994334 RepID=A0A433D8Z2_9FUNG|nr:hypothetical protein BC936DRAFT_145833 [Jimgerdemannia flammicorona]